MKIVLGSASPRRKQILESLGFEFEVISPNINEKIIRDENPERLVIKLANAKADALVSKVGPCILITCDVVVVLEGKILEKPESPDEARQMLQSYGTKPVKVVAGVVVTNTRNNKRVEGVDLGTIFFRPFTEEMINEYIESGQPYDLAGGFAIQDPQVQPFVDKLEGELECIIGLPKKLTQNLLNRIMN